MILISADGVIIRIQASSIRICARPSKGVRVMRIVGENNKVVTLSRAPHEENEEPAEDAGDETEAIGETENSQEENSPEEAAPQEE